MNEVKSNHPVNNTAHLLNNRAQLFTYSVTYILLDIQYQAKE